MADPFDKRDWECDSLNEINVTSVIYNASLMRRQYIPYEKQKHRNERTLFPAYDIDSDNIDPK